MTHLNAIAQKDGLAIAVGEESAIWHVDEAAGPTGERISAPRRATGVALHTVAIRHRADAWAVGEHGTVLRWDGSAWHHRRAGLPADCLLLAICVTDTDAWLGGPGGLWRWSRNAALPVAVTAGPDAMVHALHAPGPLAVHCLCSRRRLLTFDGTAWSAWPLPPPEDARRDVWALGSPQQAPAELWAGGDKGALLRFDGSAWQTVPLATPDALTALCCAAPELVYLATEQGALLEWHRGTPRQVAVSPSGPLWDVCLLGADVLAVGPGGLLRWASQPDQNPGNNHVVTSEIQTASVRISDSASAPRAGHHRRKWAEVLWACARSTGGQ